MKRPTINDVVEVVLNDRFFRIVVLIYVLAGGGDKILAVVKERLGNNANASGRSDVAIVERVEDCEIEQRKFKRRLDRFESKLDRALGLPPRDYAFDDGTGNP